MYWHTRALSLPQPYEVIPVVIDLTAPACAEVSAPDFGSRPPASELLEPISLLNKKWSNIPYIPKNQYIYTITNPIILYDDEAY